MASTDDSSTSQLGPQPLPTQSDTSQQAQPMPVTPRFRSFWIGGFECSTHRNRYGERLDLIATTQHDVQAEEDYARARSLGMRTVRDGLRWHLIEHQPGRYDFSSLAPMAEAAERQGVQVIWDLLHYGWPEDLDIFSAAFIDRYVAFARAAARFLAGLSDEPLVFTPVNEISFFTWAMCVGKVVSPFAEGRDWQLKQQLVRAALAVSDALWELDPRTQFLHGDPMLHVIAPPGDEAAQREADGQNTGQFQAWDMLAGRVAPELGGDPKYLGTIGVNYYFNNQWIWPDGYLDWETDPPDPRRIPPRYLLRDVYERYRVPIIIGETSHIGVGRARWLRHICEEVQGALELGVPLGGVCLYPIIDRCDWDDSTHWHNSGMWDLRLDRHGTLQRVLYEPYAKEWKRVQKLLPPVP